MKHPNPTRKFHEKFCQIEKWTRRTTSTGKTGTHHINYELTLADGRILLTRVSHPANNEGYGRDLWQHILKDQLEVTELEFWDCVQTAVLPKRGSQTQPTTQALPLGVVKRLSQHFHVSDDRIGSLTPEAAVALLGELETQAAIATAARRNNVD